MDSLKVKVTPYSKSVIGVFDNKRIESEWTGMMHRGEIIRTMARATVQAVGKGEELTLIDSVQTLDRLLAASEDEDTDVHGDAQVDSIYLNVELLDSSEEKLGKKVYELHSPDVKLLPNRHITGSLPYVDDFTGFSNNTALQKGYYLCLNIKSNSQNISVRLNGDAKIATENVENDKWVIARITEDDKYIDIKFDNDQLVRLHLDLVLIPIGGFEKILPGTSGQVPHGQTPSPVPGLVGDSRPRPNVINMDSATKIKSDIPTYETILNDEVQSKLDDGVVTSATESKAATASSTKKANKYSKSSES